MDVELEQRTNDYKYILDYYNVVYKLYQDNDACFERIGTYYISTYITYQYKYLIDSILNIFVMSFVI